MGYLTRSSITLLALTLLGFGCGKEDESPEPADKAEAANSSAAKKRKPREKKDRGEGAMKIAGIQWKAEAAKAKLKGTTLTIKASHTDVGDGKTSRQELHLQIKDFNGPGEYKTGMSGSRFIGVGLDTAAAEAGNTDQAAVDALTQAKHLMLAGAMVNIEAASETEISGTFAYEAPKGSNQPSLSEGTFRAVVK